MNQNKNPNFLHFSDNAKEVALRVGAWALTATAMLGLTEGVHREFAAIALPAHQPVSPIGHEELMARGEGARESARLPEEYDIGLRSPNVTGE